MVNGIFTKGEKVEQLMEKELQYLELYNLIIKKEI